MKKAISLLLSLVLCFTCAAVAFADENDFVIENGKLTAYNGNADRVVVPEGVKTLGNSCLNGKSMTELTLPDSLEVIEDWAISWSERLKTVTLPKNVKEIGSYVFDGDSSLKSIQVAEGNPYFISVDGVLFDRDCEILLKYPEAKPTAGYELPGTVKTIGAGAFYATDLTEFSVGNKVEEIRGWAFGDCPNLTGVTIGQGLNPNKGLKKLGDHVFSGSQKLASVFLPAALEEIGVFTFDNCTGLTAIDVATGGKHFDSQDGVLYSRDMKTLVKYPEGKSAKGFKLPESVTGLYTGAFTRSDFTEIDLTNVTDIGNYALNECHALKTVSLGEGLTHVGKGAFVKDDALRDVYYEGTADAWEKITVEEDNAPLEKAEMHYGGSSSVPHPERTGAIGDPWKPEDLPAAGKIIFDDDWGDDLPYTLDDKGTLTISGSGATFGYVTAEFQTGFWSPGMPLPFRSPLYYYKDDIKIVVLTNGLTILGPNVFYGCDRITDVYFDGAEEEWNAIDIREGNECLTGATIHFKYVDPAVREITVASLPEGEEAPEIDTSAFSLNAGLDGGSMTGQFRYAAGQAFAYDSYFTLTTGEEGGEYTFSCPVNGKDDLYRFTAEPHAAYRLTYTYGFASGVGADRETVTVSNTFGHSASQQVSVSGGSLNRGVLNVTLLQRDAPAGDPDPTAKGQAPGDVDGNGKVESADARLALRASVKLETYAKGSAAFRAADVDGSGDISASDARYILRASVNLEDLSKLKQ